MAAKNARSNSGASLQTVLLEFFQVCAAATRHSIFETQKAFKKQFAKGRTIIFYSQSLCSKLSEMASVALTLIAKTLYSDSPGMQSMPQLWKSLHKHWARPSADEEVEWNDDLVGLFNAVARKDILHYRFRGRSQRGKH